MTQFLKIKINSQQNKNTEDSKVPSSRFMVEQSIQYPYSQQSQIYQLEKIHIRDPQLVKEKLTKMVQDGPEELQVITDFDQTITAFEYGGSSSPATIGVFRHSEHSPPKLKKNMTSHYAKYGPIEKDQAIKIDAKNILMKEWYQLVSEEFKEAKFSTELSNKILNTANLAIRHLFEEFLKKCYDLNISYYVVSGGLDLFCHTILDSIIPVNSYDNLEVLSNRLIVQEDCIVDLKMEVVSTGKSLVLGAQPFQWKKHTLLLGDLPSDYYMSKHIQQTNQISIGFVHHEINLPDYSNLFDIVIVGEPTYLVPLAIISKIFKQTLDQIQLDLLKNEEYSVLNQILA